MNELALFAGAGGGILGGHLLGWRTVCAVEREPYAASVLLARQNDGLLPPFPVWDDVRTFDGRPWRGIVDVVSGGFPCQDISSAGKGAGINGERSGLWREMARIIGEVRPRLVFVENSPVLTSRGLDRVLGDLAEMGFDAKWGVVSAEDVGAPHRRERIWIVANASRRRFGEPQEGQMEQPRRAQAISTSVVADAMRERNRRKPGETNKENEEVWADGIGCSHEAIDIHSDVADANDSRQRAGSWHGEGQGEFQAGHYAGRRGKDLADANSHLSWPGDRGKTCSANKESQASLFFIGGDSLADAYNVGSEIRHTEHSEPHQQREANHALPCSSHETDTGGADAPTWWISEPDVGRVANGVAARVDRLKAIGNGQVPLVAATAFELLARK